MHLRRSLVLVAVLLTAAGTTRAAEPPEAAEAPASSRAMVRALLRHRRFDEARVALLSMEGSMADKAAAYELTTVLAAWSQSGLPLAVRQEPSEVPEVTGEEDWKRALPVARQRLIVGRFDDAAAWLVALVASAPDRASAARADELLHLARECAADAGSGTSLDAARTAYVATHWYGWETLLADGVSIGAIAVTPVGAAVGYVLGAPLVHGINGHAGKAAASLGLRVAAPVAGSLLAYAVLRVATQSDCRGLCVGYAALFGGIAGIATAITVDAAVLAREPTKPQPAAVAARKPQTTAVVPLVAPRPGGVDIGVAAVF